MKMKRRTNRDVNTAGIPCTAKPATAPERFAGVSRGAKPERDTKESKLLDNPMFNSVLLR